MTPEPVQLATRRTGDVWFRTTRRWTIFSWFFLGTRILLGSYWAYIELGWGGYWAWDPVENASLMPWLVGTAFLHSVMNQEKKGMLKVWNMALIILTFSLSIFGTFLTRSGVISSVHAFATSNIGPAFGIFLLVVFFGSLLLLILRLDDLKSEARLDSLLSRESSFVFNNMIHVGIAATVLFLTVGLPSLWAELRSQIFLGSEAFVLRMQAEVSLEQSLGEIPRMQRRLPAKLLAIYRKEHAETPRLGMALAYLSGDHTMKAIAEAFSVHYTTVRRAVKEFESGRRLTNHR